MSNSSLKTYTRWSPNMTVMNNKKNTHIVIHHMAGNLSVEQCGKVFASKSRQASSNYGVNGTNIGQYVDEKNRSWATSSYAIDSKAVTIEVANNTGSPKWTVSDASLKTTIKLCADICRRNGIKKLTWTGNKNGNLHVHRWYASTACPGPYLYSKMGYIAKEVNKLLNPSNGVIGRGVLKEGVLVRKSPNVHLNRIDTLKKGEKIACYKTDKDKDGRTWWAINSAKNRWIVYSDKKKTYVNRTS